MKKIKYNPSFELPQELIQIIYSFIEINITYKHRLISKIFNYSISLLPSQKLKLSMFTVCNNIKKRYVSDDNMISLNRFHKGYYHHTIMDYLNRRMLLDVWQIRLDNIHKPLKDLKITLEYVEFNSLMCKEANQISKNKYEYYPRSIEREKYPLVTFKLETLKYNVKFHFTSHGVYRLHEYDNIEYDDYEYMVKWWNLPLKSTEIDYTCSNKELLRILDGFECSQNIFLKYFHEIQNETISDLRSIFMEEQSVFIDKIIKKLY
jgi:hypothetical protein